MTNASTQVDLAPYQVGDSDFAHLSLIDLLTARELYHAYLTRHPNVVATAVGRYRIRVGDSWPNEPKKIHGHGVRHLDNSEVRPYSWPCILVFVSEWQKPADFANHPSDMVPPTLFLPDGRAVPVCVIEAPKEATTDIDARDIRYPINNIGPGNPVLAVVQRQDYAATIACLVSDGHRVYALTNRHVTGDAGEAVWAKLDGKVEQIGVSSAKQLTRLSLSTVYPNLVGHDTFVNLDVGMIDIEDLARWTTKVRGVEVLGPMADFSGTGLSLSLVGCRVRGLGAASGEMHGEIQGLFYRYQTRGGFEYVADLFIGPLVTTHERRASAPTGTQFATHPGDSGALWMLEPAEPGEAKKQSSKRDASGKPFLPLAMQWGRNMLHSAEAAPVQSFALATLLSRVCALLEVDPVRDWNIDEDNTWGSVGHFSIAARGVVALSKEFKNLKKLISNNALIISHDDETILTNNFKGLGSDPFVPLADVPDFYWKPRIAKQGHSRPFEGPNHFADMDQPDPQNLTLLQRTSDDATFVDPDKWNTFYDTVRDLLSGQPISALHRGLLPFRVWQIFDAMVEFARAGEGDKYLCAAGVLTHYVGDACQPLHISYLHDGDPERAFTHTFSKGKKAGQSEQRALGVGVHSAYEDAMVGAHRKAILAKLSGTPTVEKAERIATGQEAASKTIELMRNTFGALPPEKIVQAYIDIGAGGKASSDALWDAFGDGTMKVMQDGAHLIALLWESAWNEGGGEQNVKNLEELTHDEAMAIVMEPDFLPSVSIDHIGTLLSHTAVS
jgi:hypothetical protein